MGEEEVPQPGTAAVPLANTEDEHQPVVPSNYPPGPEPFVISLQELNDANEAKDNSWLVARGGVPGLAAALHSDSHDGLSPSPDSPAMSLEARQAVYGANRFKEVPPKGFFYLWLQAMKDPIIILLIVAALISTVLGVAIPEERHDSAWSEGIAIWVAIFVVTLVAATQDWHKDRQFQKLNQQNNVIEVKVLRGGSSGIMPSTDLVVGDVLLLDTGDKLVADCLYITGHDLVVDESSLTGEADPMKKNEKEPWLRSGTTVSEGSGRALVVAVGSNSEWGKTLALVVRESDPTPLQNKLEDLAKLIGKVGLFFAIVCFVALMIRWMVEESGFPLSEFAEGPLQFFMFAVTIVVVAVPEGLPLAVTLSLAYSMKKMMKDNNFVRQLAACETMGGATAICSDKTGTLTENRMTVVEVWVGGKRYTELPQASSLPPATRSGIEINCALNSKAFITVPEEGGPPEFAGNRTECALLMMLRGWGTNYQDLRLQHESAVAHMYGFTSERKMASVLLRQQQDGGMAGGAMQYRLYNKGASEIVVGRCSHWVDAEGQRVEMTDSTRRQLMNSVTAMASCGLRTLGLAYRDLEEEPAREAAPPEDEMTLLCVVGIKDPVRKEVPAAVQTCQDAGIFVRMVTGDNIHTARHIARECGILTNGGIAMEGPKFRSMPEEELIPLLPRLQVLARSSPQDKHTLVNLLKRQGEVVGVTGDGTNDAPALKEADVGLAMGIAGTEVAKEAADIVILDDNFNSIVKSVLWGRNTFASIRKFLQFQLTVNVVALVVAFVAAVSDGTTPLNVLQLLWVNLIMDAMGALALATEMPNQRLLNDRPHGRKEHLINGKMIKHILTQSAYQIFWCFLIFYGLPRWLDAFALPSTCDYYSSPTLSETGQNLCCNPGKNCNVDQGGIYLPGETPICEWKTDGGCHIEEPEGDNVRPQLKEWYDTADDAYTDAKETAQRKTNSIVFNAFIFCQIFNMINCRKINDEFNVFENIFSSKLFWIMFVIMCIAQVAIVEGIPGVFKINRQSWGEWLAAVAIGSGSLLVSVLVKALTRAWYLVLPPGTASARVTELMPRFGRSQRNTSCRSEVSISVSAGGAEPADEAPEMLLAADERPAGGGSKKWDGPLGPVLSKSGSKNGGSRRWDGPQGLSKSGSKNGSKRWDGAPAAGSTGSGGTPAIARSLSKSSSKGSGRWEAPPGGGTWDEESKGSKRWAGQQGTTLRTVQSEGGEGSLQASTQPLVGGAGDQPSSSGGGLVGALQRTASWGARLVGAKPADRGKGD